LEPVVPLRIGLHIGEVFYEGDKALGDGVNVASRVQSLGKENTILFSAEIHDKIKNNPSFKTVSLGSFNFKNVTRPLEVFALANEGLHVPQRKRIEGKLKKKNTRKRNVIAAASVLLLVIAAFFIYQRFSASNSILPTAVKSIAVLPFVNMSADPAQEYFSDGLAEQLINILTRNPKLLVIARTSSFSFKGKGFDIQTIAEKQNVKNILEGSVQKSGNNLRISASLVNVETDATLWSNIYNGTLDNIFALQDSISGSVAEALRVALLGKDAIAAVQKTNPEAYNAYLLGNHFFELRGKENWEKAAGYYEQSLKIDSGYAPAWVSLSLVHFSQADQSYVPVDVGYLKARQEAEKALAIDPNLARAYARMGWIKQSYDWDWAGADEAYKRALQLEPGNAGIISVASNLASTLGRFDEAIKLQRRSIEIDPVSAVAYNNLGFCTFYAGLYNESMAAYRKCLELMPQYPGAHWGIGLVYFFIGKPDSALAEMNRETEPVWHSYGLALVYYTLGRTKEADDELATFIKEYQNDAAFQVAEIYAWRGEKDKAFEWLERAYNQRDGGLSEMKGDPLLRNIEKDSRYTAFLKKMKLPL
jgi:adenylate cyclase